MKRNIAGRNGQTANRTEPVLPAPTARARVRQW